LTIIANGSTIEKVFFPVLDPPNRAAEHVASLEAGKQQPTTPLTRLEYT